MTDLLPCPVCGKQPDPIVDATRLLGMWRVIHRCPVMGFMEAASDDKSLAIAKWNTRTSLPAIPDPAGAREKARTALEWFRGKAIRDGLSYEEVIASEALASLTPAGKDVTK